MTRLCIAVAFAALLGFSTGCKDEPRTFKRPASLSLGSDGSIFVSDFHNHRVVHLSSDGQLVRVFGERGLGQGQLWQAWDVLALRDGRVLVMNQRMTHAEDETDVFEVKEFKDGDEIATHRISDGAVDKASWPDGMARGLDGQWLIPDTGNHVLKRFSPTWRPQAVVHAPDGGPKFEGLSTIVRAGDELWTVEQYAHRIRRLTLGLRELARFGERGRGKGQLLFPSGITACPGKWAAVADFGNYRVQRFDSDGTYLDEFSPEGVSKHAATMLMGIAMTPDCERLVLVDSKGNRVLVTTPEGEVLRDIRSW